MLEHDIVELHFTDALDVHGPEGAGFLFDFQDRFEIVERHFGLAIDIHDIPNFLQRAEDEERINPAREKLSDCDRARKDQIQHQS